MLSRRNMSSENKFFFLKNLGGSKKEKFLNLSYDQLAKLGQCEFPKNGGSKEREGTNEEEANMTFREVRDGIRDRLDR